MGILACFVIIVTLVITLIVISNSAVIDEESYWELRKNLIEESMKRSVGANLTLTTQEESVNEILMKFKTEEFDKGFANPMDFLAAQHFFESRDGITESEVFKIIQQLPKGASLHCHDFAILSEEALYNLTFTANLYVKIDPSTNKLELKFFNGTEVPDTEAWKEISQHRQSNATFNDAFKSQLTLRVTNPKEIYSDVNNVWKAFEDIFILTSPLVTYKPVFKSYFYEALKELHDDNVKYLEFRGTLPNVYDLEGNVYGPEDVVGLYVETLGEFRRDYPDFWDAKFIYAPPRGVDGSTFESYLEIYTKIKTRHPEFVIGFDLVGQEDKGQPLKSFISQLSQMQDLPTFFHAGETNWYGESTDHNLFDAILLNTTRIGHGYAIVKHPRIQEIVKERDIALEISPISNHVLKLVDDIRNHPGTILLANGYPVVITNDDPSFWGAKGLSYDWYMAFMGMSSKETDIRLLKQLAINSIVYSSMGESEKNKALESWNEDWENFIKKMLER